MKKAVPVGHEDFKEIREKNLYYVDKTLMIKELIDGERKILLFTRPRRFGKTLNLSMIRRFFECERDRKGRPVNNGNLFEGLAIAECGERYQLMQQQYPVISLSLKSAKQPSFEMACAMVKKQIAGEFKRHSYVLIEKNMTDIEKETYRQIMNMKAEESLYLDAIGFLSECLAARHGKKVIILIDEYDVPLENAYVEGFYDQMIGFIRSLFESALKTNPNLEKGVVTGCLRISRESIFTGLNNLEIHSVLSPLFDNCYGFTENEVKNMLSYYDLEGKYPELKEWYDGYRFGTHEIYNPWSIMNYVKFANADYNYLPRPYWSNTSSNSIIKELVDEADERIRRELEVLMNGGTINKPVHEEITYGDIHESGDNLWNFLFFTGYLKYKGETSIDGDIYLDLAIPNLELASIYRNTIQN